MTETELVDILRDVASLYAGATYVYKRQSIEWKRWRYDTIAKKLGRAHASAEDRLDRAIKRIEFYDESTHLSVVQADYPRHDILGVDQANLNMEQAIQVAEKRCIDAAMGMNPKDAKTADVILKNLKATEKLIARFEAKVRTLTKDMDASTYLAVHIHG